MSQIQRKNQRLRAAITQAPPTREASLTRPAFNDDKPTESLTQEIAKRLSHKTCIGVYDMPHTMRYIAAGLAALAIVVVRPSPVSSQGILAPYAKLQFFTDSGAPLSGGLLYTYAAGTTTPQTTYSDSALSVPNANPVVLDSAGRATVYLPGAQSFKFTLRTSAGVEVWTQDNIVGPYSGVLSITTANTRGIQISRSGADAGLSVASTGGSGKTYGIVSTTGGALRLRDDSDGTPQIELSGNDITLTATGNVTVSGGTLVASTANLGTTTTGALTTTGAATLAAGGTVNSSLSFESPNNAQIAFRETDAAADNGRWDLVANGEQMRLRAVTDAFAVANAFTVDRTGGTVDAVNLMATATTNTGRYNSATAQPGFLAYNSAADNAVATGATVDFDTEVYDEASNFATDTFTAPVTGRYQLCVTVTYSDNAASTYALRIVTSARSYRVDWSGGTTSGVSNGCVYADMASGATASIQVDTGDGTGITIEGGASPLSTFFSGRLVP